MVTEIEMAPEFFIGREKELGLVEDLLTGPWGSRQVLLVHGPGGVGKTRLLREIHRRREEYAQRLEKPLLFTRIIDFDDVSVRVPWSFGQHLVAELGQEQFREYLDAQEAYVQYQLLSVSSDLLREQDERSRREFIRGYNRVADQKRICLLFDTTEKVQDTELWRYLQEAIEEMKNTVLVIAGRELDEIESDLKGLLGQEAVHFRPLCPFDKSETLGYFLHTDVGVEIEPEMREKLYLLSGGHPIFIALAVEWLRRDMPIDHITTRPLAELQALDEEGLALARKEFETILVNKILDLTPIDQAVLRMAHVYLRFDDKILQYLLELSDEETVFLSHELHNFPFIRPKPPNIYTLHDEMRRLVNEHTWPKIDPHDTQRRSVSAKMVSYYNEQLETLGADLDKVRSAWEKARKHQDAEQAAQVFPRLNELEQQRMLLEVERFHYLLDVDLEQAFDYFLKVFEEATHAYRFALRETVVNEIQKHREQLSPEQQYAMDSRRAKHLLDQGDYSKTRALLLEILERKGLLPDQQTDMLIELGNVEIRLGDLMAGITKFEEAVQISERHSIKEWLLRAEIALGWGHRLIGHFDIALQQYAKAQELSIEIGDNKREAWNLNNLAYLDAFQGHFPKAINLCDQALALWEELDFDRGRGALYTVYGEAYLNAGRYDESREYLEKALSIFEPHNDREWLSTTHVELGKAEWLSALSEDMGKTEKHRRLETAKKHLEIAQEIDIGRDRAAVLHYLGHVYLSLGEISFAEDYFHKSYKQSQEASDAFYELNTLGDLAWIAVLKEEFRRLGEFMETYREFCEKHPSVTFPPLRGLLLKYVGDLALGATPDNIENALEYYKEAFLCLTQHRVYAPYQLQPQLIDLDRRIRKLAPKQIENLGNDLYDFWEAQGLNIAHTEARRFFLYWRKGETVNV